jgi:flagellar motor switch/type III secretory pathway protein FliN
MPSAVTIGAKGAGEVEILPGHVALARAGEEIDFDGMDAFPLEYDGQHGWVAIGHRVSLALVCAVLGGPAPLAMRALAGSERGVMAAVVLSALDALGVPRGIELGLGGVERRPDSALPRFVIGGSLRTATAIAGRALVVIPVGWLAEAGCTGPVRLHLDGLAASAAVELARTDLLGAVLASAAVGDAVVFDGVAGTEPRAPWPVRLRVGDFVAPACVAADGALVLAGPFYQAEEDAKQMAAQDETLRRSPGEPSSSEAARILATAPVEVVAEIGRFTLRGDELAGLMKGGVVSLGPRRAEAIQLRVGGQLWAVGELVNVGDELGVRILRLHEG